MIDLKNISQVYFIGIGGIGMSALARYFNRKGCTVSGYDKTPSQLTKDLEAEGIKIHFTDDVQLINKEANLIVYTPAIPAEHNELNWYNKNNYQVVKRSDVLQAITETSNAICVAGTHGKTTISSMISHLLTHSGFGCNAYLGGVMVNYDTNYLYSDNPWSVVEADEYDRSFLKLSPQISVVSAMDADHLDIYGTAEEMEKAYFQFANATKEILFYKHGLKQASNFKVEQQKTFSAQNDSAAFYAQNIVTHHGSYRFTICKQGEELCEAQLNMGGMHNIENAMAAFAVGNHLGIETQKLVDALASFKGVKRRFEYIFKSDTYVYIDDYAHHPEELRTLIQSAKSLFRNQKVSVVFQPHLFSRTRDLADGFASSLDEADEIILLEIYPARELPMEGVGSEMIKKRMNNTNVTILSKESVLAWADKSKPKVLITAGAGDIDQLVKPLKQLYNEY